MIVRSALSELSVIPFSLDDPESLDYALSELVGAWRVVFACEDSVGLLEIELFPLMREAFYELRASVLRPGYGGALKDRFRALAGNPLSCSTSSLVAMYDMCRFLSRALRTFPSGKKLAHWENVWSGSETNWSKIYTVSIRSEAS